MSIIERLRLLRSKDKEGNEYIDYPITTLGAVKGLETELANRAKTHPTIIQSYGNVTYNADGTITIDATNSNADGIVFELPEGEKCVITVNEITSTAQYGTASGTLPDIQNYGTGRGTYWSTTAAGIITFTGDSRGKGFLSVYGGGKATITFHRLNKALTAGLAKAATYVVAASDSINKERADFICTGTNDQTVIGSAINALPANGGKIVLLDGTYNLGSWITVQNKNITIEGMGNGTILKRMFNNNSTIWVPNAEGCRFAHFKIDDNKDSYTTNEAAIQASGSTNNFIIEDITFINCSASAIWLNTITKTTIQYCHFDNVNIGILIDNSYRTIIHGCRVENASVWGIYSKGLVDTTIAENIFLNCLQAVMIDWAAIGTKIVNNYIDGNGIENSIGIQMTRNNFPRNNIVTGNHVFSCSQNILINADYTLIVGNYTVQKDNDTDYSIRITGSRNLAISNYTMSKSIVNEGSNNICENNMT